MDKENQALDQYLDAAAELFMDQYAAILEEDIPQDDNGVKENFPEELDKRCRELIREYHKQQRRQRRPRVFRNVAAVLLILVGLSTVLFSTVEAIRVPIMNFFIEKTEHYWQFTANPNYTVTPIRFNEADPLGELLPGEFQLTNHFGSWETGMIVADYSNNDICHIYFSVNLSDGVQIIDTEGAQVTQFELQGHPATMAVENEQVRLIWLDERVSMIFTLITENIEPDVVIDFATDVTSMFE